jgi:tungstate transport system substrate-binding protein
MGRRGEADCLLVHSPKDEEAFMQDGFGKSRQPLMYNDYVLVGPEADPAKCISATGIADAFDRVAQAKAMFISRGDKSGTHKKELAIWAQAGIKPSDGDERHPALMRGAWYLEAGQGMGEVLTMADIKAAYTLSDRGTYLAYRTRTGLRILFEGDPVLVNPYSVIVVSPTRFPKTNIAGAEAFAAFLAKPETLKLISEFGKDKYGQPLFHIYPKK